MQGGLWATSVIATDESVQQMGYVLSDMTLTAVSVCAAMGFLLYGGRLFLMLQRFPIESRGRRKKLQEVGLVTSICAGCFSLRCAPQAKLRFWLGAASSLFISLPRFLRAVFVALSAVDRAELELDVMGHPLLNVLYYSLVEIVPSACVLFILRKLPPKRTTQQGYQQVGEGWLIAVKFAFLLYNFLAAADSIVLNVELVVSQRTSVEELTGDMTVWTFSIEQEGLHSILPEASVLRTHRSASHLGGSECMRQTHLLQL